MSDADFFKEDEPAAKVEAIWNRPGKKGRTVKPPRDLNQRAKSIVDRVVEKSETDVAASETPIPQPLVFSFSTSVGTDVSNIRTAPSRLRVERVEIPV